MNVASVWLQRYGKRAKERPQIWNAQKKRKGRKKGQKVRGKSDRNAAKMKTAAKVCKQSKRAAAHCCMSTNNVRTHEYTIHTIKLHSHEYRLNIHTQTYYLHSWNILACYLQTLKMNLGYILPI